MKKIAVILFTVICITIFLAVDISYAQVVPIDLGPGDGDAQEAPLNGLAILAALGGGYAIKKLRDRKQ